MPYLLAVVLLVEADSIVLALPLSLHHLQHHPLANRRINQCIKMIVNNTLNHLNNQVGGCIRRDEMKTMNRLNKAFKSAFFKEHFMLFD